MPSGINGQLIRVDGEEDAIARETDGTEPVDLSRRHL
jgi:hypothetical protein